MFTLCINENARTHALVYNVLVFLMPNSLHLKKPLTRDYKNFSIIYKLVYFGPAVGSYISMISPTLLYLTETYVDSHAISTS